MGQFYDSCGALLRSHTVESGAFPAKRHIAIFEYERGEATFDGSRWTWQLDIVGGL
jgi:hypothetical protein